MALLRNKNQPYFPDPDSPNNYQCGPEYYCHPVTVGDTVYSQFYQTPCGSQLVTDPEFDNQTLGAEKIINGTFNVSPVGNWTYGAAWSWDAGNNEMDSTTNTGDILQQTGLSLTNGVVYRLTFDCVITNGEFIAIFGYGNPNQTQTPIVTQTGSYEFDLIYQAGIGNDSLTIYGDNSFTGSITNISVKAISYTYWTNNSSWILSDGQACHVVGQTGDLDENVVNYLLANRYYKLSFTVSGRTDGTINVYLSDVSTPLISTNGNFTYWFNPTINGVIKIEASSLFDGCISGLSVYELTNDFTAAVINSSNVSYDITTGISYYQDYVTLAFEFQDYELADGCYTLEVYDTCSDTTYTSECLNYQSNGVPRTKLLTGYCDQESFGFEFTNSGFKLQQRAEIRSIAPTYPKTTTVMKMGNGDAKVAYSEIEKYWQVHTGFASETFHDAMAAIISCDHFKIGDSQSTAIEYVAEAEDYTPNWNADGAYVLASSVFNVRVKEKGQVFNRHI